MPRDGSIVLSDVRSPTLSIVCEPCGRRGRYNVAALIEAHGDAKLTDLLVTLVKCHRAGSSNVYDRCRARFATVELAPMATKKARVPGGSNAGQKPRVVEHRAGESTLAEEANARRLTDLWRRSEVARLAVPDAHRGVIPHARVTNEPRLT